MEETQNSNCNGLNCLQTLLNSLQKLPIVALLLTIGLLYLASRLIPYILINKKYSKWIRAFRAERDREAANFLKDFDGSVPEDIQALILNASASELIQSLRDNKFTSEQAVITLALRSIKIAIPMHYAADIDFYGALELARQKDLERKAATDPSTLPILHGLPISVKDHTTCKNLRVTAGLAFSLNMEKPDFDCNYIAVLRKHGAIPFISSNVPQGLGAIETYNNIFGRASNTWNPARTVGGSSGGEAGLIASRCSVLGIGSDAAGSIRVPSAFNGIYGFAPTAKRISLKKTINLRQVDVHYYREIGCSYGPMGQNVEDLKLICKSTFGQFEDKDLDIAPIEWNEEKFKACGEKKLRIGYNFDDEFCEPVPAIRNAMMETVEKLRARGHTLIEVKHDFTARFLKVGLGIMCPYGIGNSVKILLKGEKPSGYYLSQVVLSYLPRFMQLGLAAVMEYFGQHRFSTVLRSISNKNLAQFYDNVLLREWLKDDYIEMWDSYKLDGLISPVLPFTALKHGHSEAVSGLIGGTLIYNLLGAPAGVVPVRRVQKEEQNYEPKLMDIPARVLKHNTKGSEGLPVAIQVAGMTFQDEKCLGIMREIEECFDFHERSKI